MKIINVTNHPVTIVAEDGITILLNIMPSGIHARLNIHRSSILEQIEVAEGMFVQFPVTVTEYAEIIDLPEPEPDTIYIASNYVAQEAKRPDVLAPRTDNTAIRDKDGNIVAVRSLVRYV